VKIIALDTETKLIGYPDDVNPDLVCVSMYEPDTDTCQLFHHQDRELKMLILSLFTECANKELKIVGANIAFDIVVLCKWMPELEPLVWLALKHNGFGDVQIREKLKSISMHGRHDHVRVSLGHLVKQYLDIDILQEKVDATAWRFRYAELYDTPIVKWPDEAASYAKEDALLTYRVWQEQEKIRQPDKFGSMNSENLQVAAAVALRFMSIDGIRIDIEHVNCLKLAKNNEFEHILGVLEKHGIVNSNGKRCNKNIQGILEEVKCKSFTPSGKYDSSRKEIEKLNLRSPDPRLEALLEYSSLVKQVTTFIPQLEFSRIHPEFNVIVSTLRTSCRSSNYYKYHGNQYGIRVLKRGASVPSVNLQQIPNKSNFKQSFIPEKEEVFIDCDYVSLELACFAQTCLSLFGFSDMAEALNKGENLHDTTGTAIYNTKYNKSISTSTFHELCRSSNKEANECRKIAKIINLGIPGGQGARRILQTARESGIKADMQTVYAWLDIAKNRFKEFILYFEWLRNQEYSPGFFGVEIQDVWFAEKRYTEAANCKAMQTLGAMGAKIALCNLVQACRNGEVESILYKSSCKALIHDEFLISTANFHIDEKMKAMADLLLKSLAQVIPNVRISCTICAQAYWDKQATPGMPSATYTWFKGELKQTE